MGERMSIHMTCTCVDAILDGSIKDAEFHTIPVSGFEVPVSLPGVEQKLLDPHSTWANPADYDEAEKKLARMYVNYFNSLATNCALCTTRVFLS
jgi:phosphoenolpyruvate carboxykinase (ATP)